jgi:hypothetical protein
MPPLPALSPRWGRGSIIQRSTGVPAPSPRASGERVGERGGSMSDAVEHYDQHLGLSAGQKADLVEY